MRSVVSAVMTRRPRTMSLMERGGTPIACARRYRLIPSSWRISTRCSPGWIGSVRAMKLCLKMVVGDFDLPYTLPDPAKPDAPLILTCTAQSGPDDHAAVLL